MKMFAKIRELADEEDSFVCVLIGKSTYSRVFF